MGWCANERSKCNHAGGDGGGGGGGGGAGGGSDGAGVPRSAPSALIVPPRASSVSSALIVSDFMFLLHACRERSLSH